MTRKKVILTAATELFAQWGYIATPISEIVQAAGVAKGTLFYHFKTKEGIFVYIVKDTLDAYVHGIEMQAQEAKNGLYPDGDDKWSWASEVAVVSKDPEPLPGDPGLLL